MKKPPPLPRATLGKVLRVSCLNGWSIAVIAGAATAVTLLMGDWFGTCAGALVTIGGAVEISGHRLLKAGVARGCVRYTETSIMPVLQTLSLLTYGAVILASLLHQGGLFLYYHRRQSGVVTALGENDREASRVN